MGNRNYEFDPRSFRFRKTGLRLRHALGLVAFYLLSVLVLTLLVYGLFALFFNTDTERRLKQENARYAAMYGELKEREALLADATALIRQKDNDIYQNLFHAPAPSIGPASPEELLFSSDTVPDTHLVGHTAGKASRLLEDAAQIDEDFDEIFRLLAEGGPLPPMTIPVRGVGYTQMGAGPGPRINPFYKATLPHAGLDFIAAPGADVYAPAAGWVIDVHHSGRGQGNLVRLQHDGGFETVYAHLSAISVSRGQYVSRGRKIGEVGMSGNAFAPHLHYELYRGGRLQNPVHYFFASVDEQEYSNMLYMVANTEQSMD
ncbi:MAG: M23 family metallopeptidase [Bacteroidales bacterium]|nr:M23 family metallopeptidase [Bacteroidales bacterium]